MVQIDLPTLVLSVIIAVLILLILQGREKFVSKRAMDLHSKFVAGLPSYTEVKNEMPDVDAVTYTDLLRLKSSGTFDPESVQSIL